LRETLWKRDHYDGLLLCLENPFADSRFFDADDASPPPRHAKCVVSKQRVVFEWFDHTRCDRLYYTRRGGCPRRPPPDVDERDGDDDDGEEEESKKCSTHDDVADSIARRGQETVRGQRETARATGTSSFSSQKESDSAFFFKSLFFPQ
jgi:hypothetical protein